jgi:hypothetical protein
MASLAPAEKVPSGKPLKVGSPHDPAEREADRIADLLTAPEEPALPVCAACAAGGAPCAACGGGDGAGVLRRQVSGGGEGGSGGEMVAPPSVHRALSEPGEPLPAGIRGKFERRLGVDLRGVRVHSGGEASQAAADIDARAFAHGIDLFFAKGEFDPESREGQRLFAHELAHVAQDRTPGRVRRWLLEEGTTDAANDQRVVGILELQPGINPLDQAHRVGGLAGWRQRMPLSYAEMRQRSAARYGEPAVAAIESHDADILALVVKSEAVQSGLLESRDYYGSLEHAEEREAAQGVIDFYRGATYLFREDVRGLYEVSYSYFAQQYADDIHYDLRLYQQIMVGDAGEIVRQVGVDAFGAAADARVAREQREAWSAAGAALVGDEVAEREGIFLDDSLELEAQLEPTYGGTDYFDMLAIARVSGRMSAVVEYERRYYAYTLSHDYDRTDIFLSHDSDQESKLIESGNSALARAIVTSDGFVVTRDSESGHYFGRYQRSDPLLELEADTRLLESGEADRLGVDIDRLFLNMVRNLALQNLSESEQRMNGIVSQMAPEYLTDPTRGAELQRDTARLRELTVQAPRLAEEIGDAEPTEEQGDRRDALLDEMSTLVQRQPAAAFFVQQERHTLWEVGEIAGAAAVPYGQLLAGFALQRAGVPQTVVVDQLEGLMGGDAAQRAIEEANTRRENIATVRRALFDDPDIVLGFEPLHAPVLEHFSEDQRASIRRSLAWRDFKTTAETIGLTVVDLGLLISGFFTGGATWVGLGLEAAGTTLALAQLDAQIRDAEMLSAQSQLDIPGGFQMAPEEQAASARRWAVFGSALTFLGVVGLARSASRLIRAAEEEGTLVGRIAQRAGVSSETAAAALRRTWRGIPNPDPNALREVLLSGLPRELQQRYARLPIRVLDEAEWAREFGAHSAEHAATQFASREGEIFATEVVFRRQGNLMALQEEAAHLAQSVDPRMMERMHNHANVSVAAWQSMPSAQRLRMMREVLEVELDAQERVLARAQQAGDDEAMDDILAGMDDITTRMGDIDRALADPAAGHPSWFDPSRAPNRYFFNAPRLPRTHGRWVSGVPGNGVWLPNPGPARTLAPQGVTFRNGYPNLRPFALVEVRIGQVGLASDFADADLRFAQRVVSGNIQPPAGYVVADFMHNGEAIAAGTARYRRAEKLTWHHHQGGTVMLLVPRRLHSAVPHTGGASAARAARLYGREDDDSY